MREKLLSPRLIPAAATVVVLLATAVSWFFVVSPQRSRASSLDDKISAKQLELTSAKIRARSIDPKADLAKLRLVSIAMPDGVELRSILVELLRAAQAGQVRLDGITAQPVAPLQGYSAVPLDVKVTGKYLGIKRFLHLLEAQADVDGKRVRARGRLFAIDSLDFGPGDDELPQLTATVRLNAFVFAGSAPTPAVPQPAPSTTTPSGTTATAAGRTS